MITPTLAQATTTTYGKINLSLRSGPVDEAGYHPLRTIFTSVSLEERVRVRPSDALSIEVSNDEAGLVPTDGSNLAAQAAQLLADRVGRRPDVDIQIVKQVPVAGGMGGGSADAAATLLALNELWEIGLHRRQLAALARPLGADVPFMVIGGTALGTGRGDSVTPIATTARLHIALAFQDEGISTADAYRSFDLSEPRALDPRAEDELVAALAAGDLVGIGRGMHNDLQPVAVAQMPVLADVMDVARDAGALGVIVSGSGPTVAALGRDGAHAEQIVAAWRRAGTRALTVTTVS